MNKKKENNVKNVAVTGCFASGKSYVLNCLREIGYMVFSCDDYIKILYKNEELQKLIVSRIDGLEIFDKQNISKIIFNDTKSKKTLESIIHPKVREGINEFEKQNQHLKIIFTEVPLLFESNFGSYFYKTICVFCSEKEREKRALQRVNGNIDLLKKIDMAQYKQKEKKERADFAVDSERNKKEIKLELQKIIEKFL